MTGQYSIRRLTQDDWQALRKMRIEAVSAHPDYFQGTAEDAEARSEQDWRDWVDGAGKAVFGLYDGTEMIGMTAIFTWNEDPKGETGVMAASYIRPEYRGQKLSRMLYEARLDWAKGQEQLKKLHIGHRDGNESSRRANQAFGFEYTGKKMNTWPDGTEAYEHMYELDLEVLRKKSPTLKPGPSCDR